MPIYEYQAVKPGKCTHCREPFELYQGFSEAALTQCPTCGKPVQRIFSTPAIHGAGRSADVLSNKNLAAKGFTKYVKAGDGHYEKAAGSGPDVIKR
jgi:putative FmdB family regulatory protein